MSGLYVYAVVGSGGESALEGEGVEGEALRLVACEGLRVVAGALDAPPPINPRMLAAQNETVLGLGERFTAILPTRYGQWVAGDAELARLLAPRAAELATALELVAGCVQMTLRFFSGPHPEEAGGRTSRATGGPGTRYLTTRRPQLPAGIAELREALAPWRRAEHWSRNAGPPLLATAHDLVARVDEAAYRRVIEQHRRGAEWRLRLSGPWPPYAFSPGMPG
jgi:hypothetical protein